MKSDAIDRRGGWFDHPVLSLLLAASWLALSRSLEPVHLISAALLGLGVPRLLRGLLPVGQTIRWSAAMRLFLVVLWDIVVANITVARITLGSMQRPRPAWLRVPLETDHPRVNALFASIITTTPGTVSCVIDEQQGVIWVHALSGTDPQAMAHDMKERYERPLMRVLGVSEETREGVQ